MITLPRATYNPRPRVMNIIGIQPLVAVMRA